MVGRVGVQKVRRANGLRCQTAFAGVFPALYARPALSNLLGRIWG